MKLIDIKTKNHNGYIKIIGMFESSRFDSVRELFFEYPEEFKQFLTVDADPFIPALLVPCMAANENLEIKLPVSLKLINKMQLIQDIYTTWYPNFFKKIDLKTSKITNNKISNINNVGAFFSLGVDSFYTLLKDVRGWNSVNRSPITHLIFMNGMETPLVEDLRIEKTKTLVREVAKKVNKVLITGKTNIRNLFPISWDFYYHGAGLSSVALSLSSGLAKVLIPSARSYNDLIAQGSHPLLDPLWSTERMEIIHEGGESNRSEKIAKLVGHDPLALAYLRVCVSNYGDAWNCGNCPKCIRTMISLQAINRLKDANTFPDALPKNYLKQVQLDNYHMSFLESNLNLLLNSGNDPKLAKDLKMFINDYNRHRAIKTLLNGFPILYTVAQAIYKTVRFLAGHKTYRF